MLYGSYLCLELSARKSNANYMSKILIIEDEVILLSIITDKLRNEGYEVEVATNGEEGLKKAKETNPDLILLDLVMPKMNGFEFIAVLKEDPDVGNTPIIVLSNSGYAVEIEKLKVLGVEDYLVKANFSPQEVMEKVARHLEPSKSTE